MHAPSPALLRAFLRPSGSTTQCCSSQVRHASGWTPRERFAKKTRLDILHKRQKANNRIERQTSQTRANTMLPPTLTTIYEPPSPTLSTPSAPITPPQSPSPLPYHISRTRTSNIPVYESHKAGGSKHITTLRKLSGNLDACAAQLLDALRIQPSFVDPRGIKKSNVVINRLTNQIVVRGWRGAEVKKWVEMNGF